MRFERWMEPGRERLRTRRGLRELSVHRDAALTWLRAAQDANGDGGVSHSYLVGERWMRSYPETTGYIIPTFLNAARVVGDADLERRALRMAEWEVEIQLPDGAVAELTGGRPTVFDTGQVIFGWVAAYRACGDGRFLDAALRGADWLLGQLGPDGVWRHESDSGGPGRVYNARVAWAMLELGRQAGELRFVAPATRFLEWTLEQEVADGWFDRNCLTDDEAPLLHTIAYTARGQFESARLLGDDRFLAASLRTARRLRAKMAPDGRLAGRFDRHWNDAARWSCLTGMAQSSILFQRLALEGGLDAEEAGSLRAGAHALDGWLRRRQDLESRNPGLYGGIRGSFPVHGAYGKWRVLNWATKFFVDALMLEEDPRALDHRG